MNGKAPAKQDGPIQVKQPQPRPSSLPARTNVKAGNRATSTAAGQLRDGVFRMRIDRIMTESELFDEFVRQYFRVTDQAQIASLQAGLTFRASPVTAAHVTRGWFPITIMGLHAEAGTLTGDRAAEVNAETDRRYWAERGLEPDTKIAKGDKEAAEAWHGVRRRVLLEESRRAQLHALPADVKAILFAGGKDAAMLSPDDYGRALEMAARLQKLTPEERADYKRRVTGSTTSLAELGASLDRYDAFRESRRLDHESHERAARPLFGAEDLYALYKKRNSLRKTVSMQKSLKGLDREGNAEEMMSIVQDQLDEAEAALATSLKDNGFDTEADFEAALESYRLAFQTQAVNLVLDILSMYANLLYRQRQDLAAGGAAAIVAKVAQSTAKKSYASADDLQGQASMVRLGMDPQEKGPNKARMLAWEQRLKTESRAAEGEGDAAVNQALGELFSSEKGIDRRLVAHGDAAEVHAHLNAVIDERIEDIAKARGSLARDPERVLRNPELVQATKQLLGVDKGTIYNDYVDDWISQDKRERLLRDLGLAVLAIALSVLVPVGGWVAAAAIVGGLAISTHGAITAYQSYVEESRDYRLGLITEEPSLIWVGLAIAGAALELGVAASQVWKMAAPALRNLEKPLLAFSKDGDAASLLAKIEAAEELKGLDVVKRHLTQQVEFASKEASALDATKKALFGKLYANPFFDPDVAKPAFRLLYYRVRRGVDSLAQLSADRKLIKELEALTGIKGGAKDELLHAFDEVSELAKQGKAAGMDNDTLVGFVDKWAVNRRIPGYRDRLLDEIRLWRPLNAEQSTALSKLKQARDLAMDLRNEKAVLLSEREGLLASKPGTAGQVEARRERLLEIRERLKELDPYIDQPTITKQVTTMVDGQPVPRTITEPARHAPGEISRAEAGVAAAEKGAEAAGVTLYQRLRAAVPATAARQRALRGVAADQVGGLLTKPSGTLHVDHIVPVREIVDMDGFSKLSWAQQKAIVDNPANLIAMDASANLSKGDRSWRAWKQAASFYDPAAIERMAARESEVRKLLREAIDEARKAR